MPVLAPRGSRRSHTGGSTPRAHTHSSHACVQVVFVSSDMDIDGFNEYYAEMPW